MIIPLIVTSVKKKKSMTKECAITGICLVSLEVLLTKVCNLKYKVPSFITVVFHNLSGYDSHLFIKTFGNSEGDICYIPNNEENYISFTKQVTVDTFINKEGKEVNENRELGFIDRVRFMAANLNKLNYQSEN